jgi:hypothetical protein
MAVPDSKAALQPGATGLKSTRPISGEPRLPGSKLQNAGYAEQSMVMVVVKGGKTSARVDGAQASSATATTVAVIQRFTFHPPPSITLAIGRDRLHRQHNTAFIWGSCAKIHTCTLSGIEATRFIDLLPSSSSLFVESRWPILGSLAHCRTNILQFLETIPVLVLRYGNSLCLIHHTIGCCRTSRLRTASLNRVRGSAVTGDSPDSQTKTSAY